MSGLDGLGRGTTVPLRPVAGHAPLLRTTAGLPRVARLDRATLEPYALAAAALLGSALVGLAGLSAARLLFIIGCLGVAARAYRAGGLPGHAETCVVLFVFAPMVRRIIDLKVGYDPSGTMLAGPLFALAVPWYELRRLLWARTRVPHTLAPFFVMVACVVYAWAVSAFQGQLVEGTAGAIKYLGPPVYGMCLVLQPGQNGRVLNAAARAFLVVSPVVGLYGLAQYLAPQSWDAAWMIASRIPSIGQPYPGMVRVFSTMNSPVSFAAYAACGLLLFSFMPRTFIPVFLVPVVAVLPLCLGILLSAVRTAWISIVISLLFCLLFRSTRLRAGVLTVFLGAGLAGAVALTPFGDTVLARLQTMQTNVQDDGSGDERMSDYRHVFLEDDRYLYGVGLVGAQDPKLFALDGQILMSSVQMGVLVGGVFNLCIVWAGLRALLFLRKGEQPLRLVAGALVLGNLCILPLTAVAVGEIGFLFWLLVGVLSTPPPSRVDGQNPLPGRRHAAWTGPAASGAA